MKSRDSRPHCDPGWLAVWRWSLPPQLVCPVLSGQKCLILIYRAWQAGRQAPGPSEGRGFHCQNTGLGSSSAWSWYQNKLGLFQIISCSALYLVPDSNPCYLCPVLVSCNVTPSREELHQSENRKVHKHQTFIFFPSSRSRPSESLQ